MHKSAFYSIMLVVNNFSKSPFLENERNNITDRGLCAEHTA